MASKDSINILRSLGIDASEKGSGAFLNALLQARPGMALTPGQFGLESSTGGSSKGGGVLGGLKSIGSTALKALSVPQAIAFTTLQKSGHLLAPGAVRDMSWKNLGGGFYSKYKGGAGLLAGIGVNDATAQKWGGLGLDILADPLWFVAPVKAVKGGAEAVKAGDLALTAGKGLTREFGVGTVKTKKFGAGGSSVTTRVDAKGIPKAPKKVGDTGLDADALKLIDDDGFFLDMTGALKQSIQAAEKSSGRSGGKWNIRIGSKKLNVEIPTPFKFKPQTLDADKKVHRLKNSPMMRLGHKIRRSKDEMKSVVLTTTVKATDDLGATSRDGRILAWMARAVPDGDAARANAIAELAKFGDDAKKYEAALGKYGDQLAAAGKGEGRLLDEDLLKFEPPKLDEPLPWDTTRKATQEDIKRYNDAKLREHDDTMYMYRGLTNETDKAMRDAMQRAGDAGETSARFSTGAAFKFGKDSRIGTHSNFSMGMTNPNNSRMFRSPLEGMSRETFIAQFEDKALGARVAEGVKFAEKDVTATIGGQKIRLVPELDPLVNTIKRLQKSLDTVARKETDGIVNRLGLAGSQVGDHMLSRVLHTNDPSTLSGSRLGRNTQKFIGGLKGTYTFVNPGHYFNNMWGDARNAMLNGNWRHLGSVFSTVPRGKMWKLANGDPKMLDATFTIAGQEVKGIDLYALAHITGLGTGQAESEMLKITGWLSKKNNPIGFMARTNHKREATQRFSTWIKHMQAGDDPMIAAEKTLKVHFDYGELTPFEQSWMRNAVFFYTWIKKNGLLQMEGVLTRPAFYNLINSTARAMPDMEGAPDWYKEQSWVPLPFVGGVSFADPAQDIRKLDVTGENLRQTFLAPINPFVRVPFELAGNKSSFTGGAIDKGYPTQHWLGNLVGGPQVQATKDGPYRPGINPQFAYLVDQLTGPVGSLGNALNKGSGEKPKSVEWFGRWSGLKPFYATPEAWARSQEAIAQKNKKAESIRNSRVKGSDD